MPIDNLNIALSKECLLSPDIKTKSNTQEVISALRNYYESVSAAVIIFRFNEFIYANREVERLTGFAKELLRQQISSLKIIHPDFVQKIREVISVWENGSFKKCEFDFMIITAKGQNKWVHCSANSLLVHTVPFIIITAEDTTTDRELKAELNYHISEIDNGKRMLDLKSQKITELNLRLQQSELILKKIMADRDRIVSIISHDLRTPFNTVLGFAEILLSDIECLTPIEIRQFARNIHDSASLLVQLLNSLMEWARLGNGKAEYNPRKIEFEKIIDETILVLSNSAAKKNILLQRDVMDNLFVFADKKMLRSILQNLVQNAIKFTYRNGTILITAEKENDFLFAAVKDSGTGIPEADRENLFNSEKHFSSIGTENEKGTGLGLLMCKNFVELHGGRIWVESKAGEGSVFYFTLPLFLEKKTDDSSNLDYRTIL